MLAEATFAHLLKSLTGQYVLNTSYVGSEFFEGFTWQDIDDPTHGHVNYVDKETAMERNLSYATCDTFLMRADDWSVVEPNVRGRDSVRIQSNNAFGDGLYVLDIAHMPAGCATWPAWWTLSQQGPWPKGGEIDIVEGVNLGSSNLGSLHTTANCTMPQNRAQKGTTVSTICDTAYNYNQGCGTTFIEPTSYGATFNQAGGGYYIMERRADKGISMWFFPRSNCPGTLLGGEPDVDAISALFTPDVFFPTQQNCDYQSHFNAHNIVFDLTFCGDWAGSPSVWNTSTCSSKAPNCIDFVANNPGAFSEAYWEIKSLKIYTPNNISTIP
ncbi:glycoside hydrolase family 16 protein [Paxillus rubicundulus Ve08.2h10]|uniref:Glycoside hydrolase family 16 protein n=1 Tax=Paxillus rubicundulus Ve08.2h10 TaxID=930991 RepID=A0A0D0DYB1_9AGAM|nr:glycoside hydrolase family 16 protein [Paxillus rubicundulus Ve08.2h10]